MRAKRWLAIALAAVMTVSGVPVTAMAADVSENVIVEDAVEEDDQEEVLVEDVTSVEGTDGDAVQVSSGEIDDELEEDVTAGEEEAKGENIASGKSNNITWVIDADGCLTISGSGDYESWGTNYGTITPWRDYASEIKSAKVTATNMTSCNGMFSQCENMTSLDLSKFDTSKVTDMSYMFCMCGLKTIKFKNFDTSNVTSFRGMFSYCRFTSLDLSSFNTKKVTDMSFMFNFCWNLESVNLSNFDTSKVTDISAMFQWCNSLKTVDLSNFDTSAVEDMSYMFCLSGIKSVNLSKFDTGNVTNMKRMFANSAVTTLDLSKFDAGKVTDMTGMFDECSLLGEIRTPKNIMVDCILPSSEDSWTSTDGTIYTSLPLNLTQSITLTRKVRHTYKVTYKNCAGATNPNPSTYKEGTGLTLQAASKPGCNFIGWYSDSKLTKKITGISTTAKKDMTVYAKWSSIKYTVNYVRNESYITDYHGENALSCSGSMKKQTINGGKSTALNGNAFTIKGYKFAGWNTAADGSGTSYADKTKVTYFDTTSVTLYAIWEKETYQIKYNGLTDEEVSKWGLPTEYHVDDTTIDYETLKEKIKRTGYEFGGLFKDSKYKTTFKSIPIYSTGNKIVYVKMTPVKYTVTFNSNFSSADVSGNLKLTTGGKMSKETITYDKATKLTANAFTLKGFTFKGWNTEADGSGTAYANQETVTNLRSVNGENITLYAQWEKIKYTITYKNLSAEEVENFNLPTEYYIDSEDIVFADHKDVTRTGYTFWNYYTAKNFKSLYKKISKGSTGNKTVFVKITPIQYKISFNNNLDFIKDFHGTKLTTGGKMSVQTITYDKGVKLTANGYTVKGYTFKGWNTEADGSGTAYTNQQVVTNLTDKAETLTLYAQWEKTKYTITYKNLTAEEIEAAGLPTEYYIDSEEIVFASLTAPVRENYTFVNFYTTKDFKTVFKKIATGSTGNKTVFAKWKKATK